MTITEYTGGIPNRSTQSQSEFSTNVDEFLTWLNGAVPEFNALAVGSTDTGTFNALSLGSNGTAAAPVFAFSSSPTSGLYRISADNIGLSVAGTLRYTFGASTFAYAGSNMTIGGKDVYTKINAVGTVSYTSENTGAIIESGSNANGSYVKFADGTMICHHDFAASSGADSTWTFPSTFIASPHVSGSSEAVFSSPRIFMTAGPATTTSVSFNVVNLSSARTSSRAYITARGRWRA